MVNSFGLGRAARSISTNRTGNSVLDQRQVRLVAGYDLIQQRPCRHIFVRAKMPIGAIRCAD